MNRTFIQNSFISCFPYTNNFFSISMYRIFGVRIFFFHFCFSFHFRINEQLSCCFRSHISPFLLGGGNTKKKQQPFQKAQFSVLFLLDFFVSFHSFYFHLFWIEVLCFSFRSNRNHNPKSVRSITIKRHFFFRFSR